MDKQPTIRLNNGVTIPQVGFGTFQVDEKETQRVVETALEAGYRHIDTAAGYYNEAGVGAALRASGLPREEVFLTTKLRNGDQGHDSALRAYDESRRALGVDAVDLYLIHWPLPTKGLAAETWKAFEKLYAEGAVRAIGVSNFMRHHLEALLKDAEVVPAVDQIELHPTYQEPMTQDACAVHGIAVEAYAPLGKGQDLEHPTVTKIAEAHGVTPAQVVLRWHLDQGRIVIPKSVTPERIRANIKLDDVTLTTGESMALSAMDADNRLFPDPDTFEFTQFRD